MSRFADIVSNLNTTDIVTNLNTTVVSNIVSIEQQIQNMFANFNATYVEGLLESGGIQALAPYIQAIETAMGSNSTQME